MPTVTVSEKNRRYLEKLRTMVSLQRVPTIKKTVELVLVFIENNETDFVNWVKEKKGG